MFASLDIPEMSEFFVEVERLHILSCSMEVEEAELIALVGDEGDSVQRRKSDNGGEDVTASSLEMDVESQRVLLHSLFWLGEDLPTESGCFSDQIERELFPRDPLHLGGIDFLEDARE